MTEHAYPEIKIIDFGLARQIKDGEQICLIVGTPEYVGKCCICIVITNYTSVMFVICSTRSALLFTAKSEFYFTDQYFCILQELIFRARYQFL